MRVFEGIAYAHVLDQKQLTSNDKSEKIFSLIMTKAPKTTCYTIQTMEILFDSCPIGVSADSCPAGAP